MLHAGKVCVRPAGYIAAAQRVCEITSMVVVARVSLRLAGKSKVEIVAGSVCQFDCPTVQGHSR